MNVVCMRESSRGKRVMWENVNNCDLPVTRVLCVFVCVCQFNEWEPVTHQTGLLIVRSPELKLRMIASMSHTQHKQNISHTHTHTFTHSWLSPVSTAQAVICHSEGLHHCFLVVPGAQRCLRRGQPSCDEQEDSRFFAGYALKSQSARHKLCSAQEFLNGI